MGRGRAKAKQTKVARRLKYQTTATDLDRLREELGAGASPSESGGSNDHDPYDGDPYDELIDRYADYAQDSYDSDDGQRDDSR
jgi:hypothetical protein